MTCGALEAGLDAIGYTDLTAQGIDADVIAEASPLPPTLGIPMTAHSKFS